jgi:hypothetical protein
MALGKNIASLLDALVRVATTFMMPLISSVGIWQLQIASLAFR